MPRGIRSTVGQMIKGDLSVAHEKPGAPWKSEKPEEWEDKIYRGDGRILAHTDGKPELPDYEKGPIPFWHPEDQEIDMAARFNALLKDLRGVS